MLHLMIPLISIAFSPNALKIIFGVLSKPVLRYKDIPILPEPTVSPDIKSSIDFTTIQCYTSGRFW